MSAPTGRRAFVTLLTSDSYLAGALTCINSLLDVEGAASKGFDTVCLVTPATVGQASMKALQKTFDAVVGVAEITTESWKELDLLGRKDLAASLTKLHLFRLTQYSKLIFLDADTLVLRPLSPLFDLPQPFSAAPDSGWPDAFNSGVMVTTPSEQTFKELIDMMADRGTWDGGDQGLLNDYFSVWNRLSFTYNVTPSAYYTYAPAYRRHGSDVAVLHFIGKDKPWKRGQRAVYVPNVAVTDYYGLVNQWFDVFERHFGTGLTYDVASRVINPPASFKSTYIDLAPHAPAEKPIGAALGPPPVAPIAIASSSKGTDSPPHLTWDPATSSPPRDPNALQMRVPITGNYENMWDDPSRRKQKARFQPPSTYAAPPPSTHDWYKEIMAKQPDPTAVRPVFPWEKSFETDSAEALKAKASKEAQATATQPPPKRDFPSSTTNSPPNEPTAFSKSATFTNAWDAFPGINRYAKSLARSTKKNGLAPLDTQKTEKVKKDDLGGRQSSLKELVTGAGSGGKGYEKRSDASSRDGDDEDDDADTTETEDEDERDRYRIAYKGSRSSSQSAVEKGELSPTNTRSRSGDPSSEREYDLPAPRRQGSSGSSSGSSGDSTPNPQASGVPPVSPTKTRKDSRFVPTSPRQSQGRHTFHSTSSTTSSDSKPLRLNTSAPLPTTGAISPRLAAQAIRNSAAARLSSTGTGTGNGPPVVRATRVFSPETDTTVVKQQGLAALQRFVENFEAATGSAAGGSSAGAGPMGGAGTAGSWRF